MAVLCSDWYTMVLVKGADVQQNTSAPFAWVEGNISHKYVKGKSHLSDIIQLNKGPKCVFWRGDQPQ